MISFFVCGDIYNKNQPDGSICSKEITQHISTSDFAICNFEGPIMGYGKKAPKAGAHLSQEPKTIERLKQYGFDLLLLANNHMLDFGPDALIATMNMAYENDLETIGAGLDEKEIYTPFIKQIKDKRFGIVNASEAQYGVFDYFSKPNEAGYAWVNHSFIDKSILELKKRCDYVLVFSHAGLEYYPIPQKEWRKRYKHFCDLGADIVVGSHPHVPQGVEEYNDSIIFYSLGNFYFDRKNSSHLENRSYSISLEFETNKKIKFQPIFHFEKSGSVNLASSENQIDLSMLSSKLNSGYVKEHDEMCLDSYNKLKRSLTISAKPPIPLNGELKTAIRLFISRFLGRSNSEYREEYQLHLLKNEAYYYAIRHALEIKAREVN